MEKPNKHILVCCSFRTNGTPQGVCSRKDAANLLQYLDTELNDRGMTDVMVSSTGCLKMCDKGPVLIVYPEGTWYGHINEEAVDSILDAIEKGTKADQYVIA